MANLKGEFETKERVDALEAWLVEVESRSDSNAADIQKAAADRGSIVDETMGKLTERLAAAETSAQQREDSAAEKFTALEERIVATTASTAELAEKLEVVAALQEEGAASVVDSVDKMGLEIEKNRLHISECAKTMGTLKTGIDGVKDRVSAHDKLDARMVRLNIHCARVHLCVHY